MNITPPLESPLALLEHRAGALRRSLPEQTDDVCRSVVQACLFHVQEKLRVYQTRPPESIKTQHPNTSAQTIPEGRGEERILQMRIEYLRELVECQTDADARDLVAAELHEMEALLSAARATPDFRELLHPGTPFIPDYRPVDEGYSPSEELEQAVADVFGDALEPGYPPERPL